MSNVNINNTPQPVEIRHILGPNISRTEKLPRILIFNIVGLLLILVCIIIIALDTANGMQLALLSIGFAFIAIGTFLVYRKSNQMNADLTIINNILPR